MNKDYNIEEKLDFILSLEEKLSPSNEDWNNIKKLSEDNNSEIRLRVTELLALFPSGQSENLLVTMLSDTSHLVRASACDSLSFSNSINILKLLTKVAKDNRYLVRGYAILSIGDIQNHIRSDTTDIINFLKYLDSKESSEWVKIAIYRSLYALGEYSYGNDLLKRLDSKRYRNRCFVLSLLEQLDANLVNNIPNILHVLNKKLEVEKTLSVKLKLQSLINKINNLNIKILAD